MAVRAVTSRPTSYLAGGKVLIGVSPMNARGGLRPIKDCHSSGLGTLRCHPREDVIRSLTSCPLHRRPHAQSDSSKADGPTSSSRAVLAHGTTAARRRSPLDPPTVLARYGIYGSRPAADLPLDVYVCLLVVPASRFFRVAAAAFSRSRHRKPSAPPPQRSAVAEY